MRALVVTHGDWGHQLIASARDVFASDTPVEFVSNTEYGVQDLSRRIEQWLEEEDDAAVILVDVSTGSCGTAALLAAGDREATWILGGVNMAMLLTYLSGHANLEPMALVTKMLDRSLNSVHLLTEDS